MSTGAAFAAILTADVVGAHFAVVTSQQRWQASGAPEPGPGAASRYLSHSDRGKMVLK
jgi:hypothetical protein